MTPESIPFLQPGRPWPPPDQVQRLQRYEANKRLFQGRHSEVLKDWIRLLREDKQVTLELAVNFPGAVSKLFTDLLFGEPPRFVGGQEGSEEQKWLDEFIAANRMVRLCYRAGLAQSYRGEAILKLRLVEGRPFPVVDVVPATTWYPVMDEDNVAEIAGHVLAWVKRGMVGGKEVEFLRAEIHLPGMVHQRAWNINDGAIGSRVPLNMLYSPPPADDAETGVEGCLVVNVPNLELDDSPYGQDDYEEAETLFQELDVRLAQIARVLDKHTDPNMAGPKRLISRNPETGEPEHVAGGNYYEYDTGEPKPEYLVWDAQLAANWQYLDRIMQGLYIATDTNAAAFSLVAEGSFPSGAALKRLLMRPLARTNRKRLFFDEALRWLISQAAALAAANGRQAPRGLTSSDVQIEWRDGLPDDPLEAAQIEQLRTGGKATASVRSAIRRLDGGSAEAIEDELIEIGSDEARNAPPSPGMAPLGGMFENMGLSTGSEEQEV